MSNGQDVQADDDGYLQHRSRPSLLTNASGFAESTISYASVTTVEALSRLSQFPIPPVGVPISPFEASLGLASPAGPPITPMTPPDTPRAGPLYTNDNVSTPNIPPNPKSGPSSPISPPPRPLPQRPRITSPGPSVSSGRTLALTATATGSSHIPSPHDWHDGSSSIAMDPYEESLLSTSFITSLLTNVTGQDGSGAPPPQYKRDPYESSVVSEAFTTETTVTYPPRRIYAQQLPQVPPIPPQHQFPYYPPTDDTARSPTVLSGPSLLYPPASPIAFDGRNTPESSRIYGSGSDVYSEGGSNVIRTAVVAPGVGKEISAVGMAHASTRAMSTTPSLQSMNSTTPLVRTFPHEDVIPEEPGGSNGPSTPGTSATGSRSRNAYKRERRHSTYSSKTTKSYVSSLITRLSHSTGGDRRSVKQATQWFRRKPLPPVPQLPNLTLHQEREYRKAEASLPLPDLMNRAQVLSEMLNGGFRPYHSSTDISGPPYMKSDTEGTAGVENFNTGVRYSGVAPHPPYPDYTTRDRRTQDLDLSNHEWNNQPSNPSPPARFSLTKTRKIRFGIGLAVLIVIIVIAVAVGVTQSHKSVHTCPANFAGASCTLDATCVCTSSAAGQCNQLAQNLVDLIPTLNAAFNASFNPDSLGTSIWQAQGSPPGDSCAAQASLVDVAPTLDVTQSPSRVQWTQAALLWNLAQSQSLSDTSKLQKFVLAADWKSLSAMDGPTSEGGDNFATQVSGFIFDFAAQTVVAPSITFISDGQPSQEQVGKVNSATQVVLDRLYTTAQAYDLQQTTALSKYWTSVLQQKSIDLSQFVSTVIGSEILLPFDATSSPGTHPLAAQLTNSSSIPFPPPLTCYPGLNKSTLDEINSFESLVFGLPAASSASQFDPTCYPTRPVYGVLDILRLRLPFTDTRGGLAKQAAVLSRDVSPRAIIYSGEMLSALPGASTIPNVNSTTTAPGRFGTLNHVHHVLYQYLSSIPDVNVAIALARYILTSPAVPPDINSLIVKNLDSIPSLEIAVLGTVDPTDVTSTVSSFSTPSGALFFGTDQSLALRQWSITATQSFVAWSELATSPKVVRDKSFTDNTFNSVWNGSFAFFHVPNNANVNVGNITSAFQVVGLFQP
ncbi:hypothetical protein C8Q75DRAFT_719680 [Abortiporus biennis]|nr:hypothetical protein C8Q75DRAFT_719680 [Abortiporus biennis]